MNNLLTLREWLTIHEAALYASQLLEDKIRSQDILRLGLDAHIRLSVVLPIGTEAQQVLPVDGRGKSQRIEGVWDLPMTGSERAEITSQYHHEAGLKYVPVNYSEGALITNGTIVCRVTPYGRGQTGMFPTSDSSFPAGTTIVVRREVIESFAEKHRASHRVPEAVAKKVRDGADDRDKGLSEKERVTHLLIIAALANHSGIELSQPYKAAGQIGAMVEALGATMSDETIASILKRVRDALERRAK